MFRKLKAGSINNLLPFRAYKASDGTAFTGLTHASSGLLTRYRRQGASAWVDEPVVSATAGAFTSGGLAVPTSGPNNSYEYHPPNAAFAAGALWVEIEIYGVTDLYPVSIFVELDAVDYQTDAFGAVMPTVAGRTLDVSTGGEAGIDLANVGSPTSTLNLSNTTVGSLTNLPAIPANWLTAAGIASGALDGKGDWMASYTQPTGFLAADFTRLDATVSSRSSQATQDVIDAALDLVVLATTVDGVVVAPASKAGYSLVVGTGLGNQTANITGNLSGSVNSVTTAVTVGTMNANTVTASALATDAVSEIQSGLATSAALTTVEGKVDSLLARITTNLFTGITSLADWLRRGFRKDSGSAGMIAAEAEINTGGPATFLGTTDSLEAIRDRGDAAWTGGGGGGGGTDWTTEEREQIRYRLRIDGDSTEPTTVSPGPIVLPPPEYPGTVGGYGVYTLNGEPLENKTIYIQLIKGPGNDGQILSTTPVAVETDEDGVYSYNQFIVGATYQIWVTAQSRAKKIVVPDENFEIPELLDW